MKINFSQTIAKLHLPFKMFVALFTGSLMILLSSSTGFAPTKLTDSELSDIDSQAMFRITHFTGSSVIPFGTGTFRRTYWTQSTDVIRLELALDVELAAHFRSFKLGYYSGGWDQDVENYYWGTKLANGTINDGLKWTGVFIDFGFDNIANDTTRQLNYLEVGTHKVNGQITGTINQMHGLGATGTGSNEGLLLRATGAGTRIVNFENSAMSFVFATKYRYVSSAHTASPHNNLSGIFTKIPDYNFDHISRP